MNCVLNESCITFVNSILGPCGSDSECGIGYQCDGGFCKLSTLNKTITFFNGIALYLSHFKLFQFLFISYCIFREVRSGH